jgi:peroxiredoxin
MNPNIRAFLTAIAAVLLLLALEAAPALIIMGSFATGDGEPALPPMTRLGDLEGTISDQDGRTLSFADLRGKVVLVNLWATWCPPCRAEMPFLQNLWREFEKNGDVLVLCISTENAEEVKSFAAAQGLDMPLYVFNPFAPPELQVEDLPTTYIFDRDGKVVFGHMGMARWDGAEVVTYLKRLATAD